jgi:hypothetical protein
LVGDFAAAVSGSWLQDRLLSLCRSLLPLPANPRRRNNRQSPRVERPPAERSSEIATLVLGADGLFAAGLISYELGAYHLERKDRLVRMGPGPACLRHRLRGARNLALGRLYDWSDRLALILGILLSACFAPVLLLGGLAAALIAMPLWGIGYAVQDSLLKAIIAGLPPEGHRGLGFGLFYTAYGGG